MITGRILAIDYGERRIGLALSDPMHIIAAGLTTLIVTSDADALRQLQPLVVNHEVNEIIIGLPLDANSFEGEKAQKVRTFSEKIQRQFSVKVTLRDERFTTSTAKKMLLETESKKKRRVKEKIDELAAVVILRDYLDSRPKKT
jgi:putative Holliday junction resolvase